MRRQVHKAVKSKTEGMFYVKYPDGELSKDHYNLSRAKDHAAKLNEIDRRCVYRHVSTAY